MAQRICGLALVACLGTSGCALGQQSATAQRPQSQPAVAAASAPAGYHPYAEFVELLTQLAARAGPAAKLETLATTAAGRAVHVLQLAAGDQPPEQRQAILLLGGLDAEQPAASETALNVARRLLDALQDDADGPAARMLHERTLYIVPRANPDGVEAYFAGVPDERRVNGRPVDEDRDGIVDEDGPNDLDGDRRIGVMRVRDALGEWTIDPDESRLMRKADRAAGERGEYKLMWEGVDDDGDGLINEDGPGGVDDDRNWPHFFEPGLPETGPHQLSEPQTRALAEFVVAHPNIAAAVVYGRHDNLVNVPKGKEQGPDGRSYRDLHPDDLPLYEHVSQEFKERTKLGGSNGARSAGALYAWLYSQRGIPTFATSLWWPLDGEKPAAASAPSSQPASAPATQTAATRAAESVAAEPASQPDAAPASQPGTAPVSQPVSVPTEARPAPKPAARGSGRKRPEASGGDPLAARVEATELGLKWLKYSDERGAGFRAWTGVDHPTLGRVEVGGFVPYFQTTPPAEELDAIAERQQAFVLQVSEWLPQPRFGDPRVKAAGADVWEIELRLINDGYLPTHLAIARQLENPPIVVRPLVERARVVGGRPMERVANLAGGGGAAGLRWLVRGAVGERVEFRASNRVYGEWNVTVTLEETPAGGGVSR